jgi:hypothetical protein
VACKVWFNGCKNIYSMNITMVVGCWNLYFYLDFGYPKSYHHVTILHEYELCRNWH